MFINLNTINTHPIGIIHPINICTGVWCFSLILAHPTKGVNKAITIPMTGAVTSRTVVHPAIAAECRLSLV
jgi:hypothetical protein